MNTNALSVVERTDPDRRKSRRSSIISGHRFALGFIIVRPQAYKRLRKFDVFLALLHHLYLGNIRVPDRHERAGQDRPVDFLSVPSSHFTVAECRSLSAFHDRRGTKFYLITLTDLSTVVSLPEEF